jgi:hypothetical protein
MRRPFRYAGITALVAAIVWLLFWADWQDKARCAQLLATAHSSVDSVLIRGQRGPCRLRAE